jgi:2-keto-4-pentenoate hydratase/2-oxohepta-3-ene-1,7-dioic acid hydratase in catechol pathway
MTKVGKFQLSADDRARLGVVVDGQAVDVNALARRLDDAAVLPPGGFPDLRALLLESDTIGERVTAALAKHPDGGHPLEDVTPAAPFVETAKILCHVVNYTAHGAEAKVEAPSRPFFFLKPGSSVAGPTDDIIAHRNSAQMDYEIELAAIIGRPGRDLTEDEVYDHIAGYTVMNDVSYRDLQWNADAPDLSARYGQNWTQGKGLDRSCVLGPWITLSDEIPDPYPLDLRTWVNGDLRQEASTNEQIYRLPALVSAISAGMTLHPGDIIATGSPGGGAIADGRFLGPGQVVKGWIESVGEIENRVVEP